MGQSKEFRIQTGIVAPPPTSDCIKIYANASGALVSLTSAGVTGNAGSFALNLQQVGGTIQTGINGATGSYYGTVTGLGPVGTFLATPYLWLPITGPSGELLVLPAYRRTT